MFMNGKGLVRARAAADPTYDTSHRSWLGTLHEEKIPFQTEVGLVQSPFGCMVVELNVLMRPKPGQPYDDSLSAYFLCHSIGLIKRQSQESLRIRFSDLDLPNRGENVANNGD
jgi:hypothetical protein